MKEELKYDGNYHCAKCEMINNKIEQEFFILHSDSNELRLKAWDDFWLVISQTKSAKLQKGEEVE